WAGMGRRCLTRAPITVKRRVASTIRRWPGERIMEAPDRERGVRVPASLGIEKGANKVEGNARMLKEASISEMKRLGISKEQRVLVNRGRGNDELAPSEDLFRDFQARKQALEREVGRGTPEAHNRAFVECRYEERFRRQIEEDPRALDRLRALAERARTEDVYLVCYEGPEKACHRRILLRLAAERFGAPVEVTGVEPRY
ncbi:MAG: DUF488 family protein, partial [Candidatus Dadabacteria bacterium]